MTLPSARMSWKVKADGGPPGAGRGLGTLLPTHFSVFRTLDLITA